jgi:hypothetical protein
MSRVSQNADYSMAFSAWTNVQEDKKKEPKPNWKHFISSLVDDHVYLCTFSPKKSALEWK